MGVMTLLVSLAAGCATFEVEGLRADGAPLWRVRETGAPLLSRRASFSVTHQWLDEETNALHECVIRRNTDENAQPQLEAIQTLAQALAASRGAAPSSAQTPD